MRVKDPAQLRRKRLSLKFSQRDLAGLVRKSQTTIYLLESGKLKTITEELALLISARLFADWEDLFELEEHDVMPSVTITSHRTSQHVEVSGKNATKRGVGKPPGSGHTTGHGVGKVA